MTLEYSANLRAGGHFGELCRKLALFMTGLKIEGKSVFPPGGVRVRALSCDDYCIADDSIESADRVVDSIYEEILRVGSSPSR